MSRYLLRSLFVVSAALGLSLRVAAAPAGQWPLHSGRRWAALPLGSWLFSSPATAAGLPRPAAGSGQLDYLVERHLWLMGGVRTLPTGVPLTPATSNADRTAYSLAGLGVGYTLSPAARAITSWTTGLGRYTVSPGSQFTVGVALRY